MERPRDNNTPDQSPNQLSDDSGVSEALRNLVRLLARQSAKETFEAPTILAAVSSDTLVASSRD